jgi:hypothetical protein
LIWSKQAAREVRGRSRARPCGPTIPLLEPADVPLERKVAMALRSSLASVAVNSAAIMAIFIACS